MTSVGTELLIVNGRVFDGTEAPARPAAVHEQDGRIAGVGPRCRRTPGR